MFNMKKFILGTIAALCAVSPVAAKSGRTISVRQECVGDRCVLRDQFGTRLGTVTQDRTGRLTFRDTQQKVQARVTQREGRTRVER